jgi:hypothetical protein
MTINIFVANKAIMTGYGTFPLFTVPVQGDLTNIMVLSPSRESDSGAATLISKPHFTITLPTTAWSP